MKRNKVFFIAILGLLLITFISGCTNVPMTPSVEKELNDASGVSVIEIAGTSLSASPSVIVPGGNITVNFTGAPGYYRDWIGLFKVGSNNYSRISYQYLRGQKNGSLIFKAPNTIGQYEFRLFRNGSYTKLATSNQVVVQNGALNPTPTPTPLAGSSPTPTPTPTPPSTNNNSPLSASPSVIVPGGNITVNFTGAPGYYRDWIGLFKVGSNNYSRISYQYLRGQKNGSLIFKAPNTIGQYEFRLFRNGSYTKLATSNQVVVQNGALNPTPTPTPLAGSSPTPSSPINYQLISQYSYGKNNVVRWRDGIIKVKDSTNYPGINVQDVLNQWNSIIGGTTTFQLSTDSTSPITIFYDAASITSQGNGVWGYATVWWSNYQLIKAEVRILPEGNWYGYPIKPKYELYLHELGHVVGFAGHTNDGSVMDAIANGSTTISSTTRSVINGLYNLPIGYALAKSPYNNVPKDGMMVIPLVNR
ncbi:hypothetical protein [Atribacter laminatus]|uniref:Uncharacterized protein n=1 Tax=Atribacter laminatus TaxID=2847778 RepID=A0A7T1AKP9_ATRLM|nr:hypothetical protein [Atribacter laminatus]QPM67689.1 hypothetical protein RT761_00901 [Atribacter laminatus]